MPWHPAVPPQHGAWAFLLVPVACGYAVAGVSGPGWLFLVAWVCAYPVGYYLGRALTVRARRGSWTRLARRERARAVPWALMTAAAGIPLVLRYPWLLVAAGLVAGVWAVGLGAAARRGERSLTHDAVLVLQAVVALPLTIAVVAGPPALVGDLALPAAQATCVVAGYLAGSVLHVKSLLREAGQRSFRVANTGWHVALLFGSALLSPWWLVATLPALARAVVLRPGMSPAAIGGVEVLVSGTVVLAAVLAG